MGTSDVYSELCPIHRFADCNDTSFDSWICYALARCVVCAVDSLGFQPTTLGQHHRDQMGWQSAGYFPCIASFGQYSLFLLRVWGILGSESLAVPFTVIVIILESIEPPQSNRYSCFAERAPSIDEAWRDAMKDGRIKQTCESRTIGRSPTDSWL